MSQRTGTVAGRMRWLVILALAGLSILCVASLYQMRSSMMEDRKAKTRNLVEVGMGVLAYHQKLAADGKLTVEEAQVAARNALRNVRYGDNDYYFGFDTNHVYYLHGGKPEWEGTNKRELQDTDGKFLIQELVQAALAGGGFVEYSFPRAGQDKDHSEPKLSYATLFKPWGWVLGTGIYIDDVNREFFRHAWVLGLLSLTLLIALGVAGWQVVRDVLGQLGGEPAEAVVIMERVASGDLTVSVTEAKEGSLLHILGGMVGSLRRMVGEIRSDADNLLTHAEEINLASSEVAHAAGQQSDAASSMAASVEQLTVSSCHISDRARDTENDSQEAVQLAGQGDASVRHAAESIQQISELVTGAATRIRALEDRANQVSSIANVIKDIAGQTNLLALNAAIEAARAGEQGRGFAVVADEVRKLAERTSVATAEIEQMIVGIQDDTVSAVSAMDAILPGVDQGVQLAHEAAESLHAIKEGALRTLEHVSDVADATREQSAASTSIAQRVELVAQMVEKTGTTVQQTAKTAQQLEEVAKELKVLVGRFQV